MLQSRAVTAEWSRHSLLEDLRWAVTIRLGASGLVSLSLVDPDRD